MIGRLKANESVRAVRTCDFHAHAKITHIYATTSSQIFAATDLDAQFKYRCVRDYFYTIHHKPTRAHVLAKILYISQINMFS